MKQAALAFALLFAFSGLSAGEPPAPGQLRAPADNLHDALAGHWREKAKLGEDQNNYYFTADKCVVHTKTVQGETFCFYDYTVWEAWTDRRTLILALRDETDSVKWVVEFNEDGRQITYRERNRKTFTKPIILLRVDDKTQP